jgi:hypothetical protein
VTTGAAENAKAAEAMTMADAKENFIKKLQIKMGQTNEKNLQDA